MQTFKSGSDSFSVFSICQAHLQLESDYNKGGILWERPSNQRHNRSTGVQLHRMKFSPGMEWVKISAENEPDSDDQFKDSNAEEVRFIYCSNVLKWNLPIDAELAQTIRRIFTEDVIEQYKDRLDTATNSGHWDENTPPPAAPAPT